MRLFELEQQIPPYFPEKDVVPTDQAIPNKEIKKQWRSKNLKGFDKNNPLHVWWWKNYGKQKSKVEKGKRGSKWEEEKWGIDADMAWNLLNQQNWSCTITHVPFRLDRHWKPSLDRKNSGKGYTPDNIQFVAACVNNAKWDMTEEEFKQMCKLVINPL